MKKYRVKPEFLKLASLVLTNTSNVYSIDDFDSTSQVFNETMDIFYSCDQVESAELVGEKLMVLVNKLVPTE